VALAIYPSAKQRAEMVAPSAQTEQDAAARVDNFLCKKQTTKAAVEGAMQTTNDQNANNIDINSDENTDEGVLLEHVGEI